MPRVLQDYVFRPAGEGSERYDYDKVMDGQIWQFFPSEDFKCKPSSFSQSLYSAAKRRGFKGRARVQADGSVVFQAYKPEAKPEQVQQAG